MSKWKQAITYATGIAGIVYETVFEDVDRPYLLVTFMVMLGLPIVVSWNKKVFLSTKQDDEEDAS